MNRHTILILMVWLTAISTGTAGTITNQVWTPSGCGTEPIAPAIESDSIETYNKSIKAINDWQVKAQAFNECVIKEANTDSALIANSANAQQKRLRSVLDKIKTDMDAAKTSLEKK
jgi:hypothetical protein